MTTYRYAIADVFTDTPLEGNPLAVFLNAGGLEDGQMQRTARELNLSETVFVLPSADPDLDAAIRIFTPGTELPFAGHPVLGTAFVLAAEGCGPLVRLQTGAGVIPISLDGFGTQCTFGEMEQPIPDVEPFPHATELLAALGVGRSRLPVEVYRNGPRHLYVILEDEQAVAAVDPDLAALAALGPFGVNVTAGADGRFKTRNFSPGLGVPEDPATGSAAGPLAVHLVRHGMAGFGEPLEFVQGVEIGRPSLLHARVEGSGKRIDRVLVGGSAVIVARGEYRLG